MALMIYNTLSRKKEEFKPIEPGRVRMYVCGMTVYDYCHLGHARVLVAFDVIVRYLRMRGFDVTYVRNITDIDDKILKRAAEHPELYKTYTDLTDKFIHEMHVDEARLGVMRPDKEPRATQHIGDIITLIEKLISNGYAYRADNGDVYYTVAKFEGYGKLSGKNPEELLAGARIEIDEAKRDPRDFALWKAAKSHEEAVWSSPWGPGRPGWHIECSAMSGCCLGETFDIHGGGPDLKFPHHENEIAQSEAATGKHYVNYWMHAGAVRVDGEKMSKSLGNFFTIREILEKYKPEVVRFLLLSSHYRSEIDYSQESLLEAKRKLDRLYQALKNAGSFLEVDTQSKEFHWWDLQIEEAMDDDFNTPMAISVLFELASQINRQVDAGDSDFLKLAGILKYLAGMLGVVQQDPDVWFKESVISGRMNPFLDSVQASIEGQVAQSGQGTLLALTDSRIDELIAERAEAKKSKNFARADEIRKQLLEQGIVLEDRKDGTTDWRRE